MPVTEELRKNRGGQTATAAALAAAAAALAAAAATDGGQVPMEISTSPPSSSASLPSLLPQLLPSSVSSSSSASSHSTSSSPSTTTISAPYEPSYIALEVLVAVATIVGNMFVLMVFVRFASLRTPSNYYIMSLAVADFLVGLLAIPFAILGHVGLPRDFHVCLFMNSLLMLLCTASILSLVALTVDRYWAIFKPFHYKRSVNKRTSAVVICTSWILSILIGLFPVFGWNKGRPEFPRCLFLEVMDLDYLLFIYVVTILIPSFFIIAVYLMIYKTVRRHLRIAKHQQSTMGVQTKENAKRDAQTAKSVLIIVFLFLVSWFPLYTINAIMLFCKECVIPQELMNFAVILSHANSVWNPGLYAWGLSDFRDALHKVMCPCRSSTTLPLATTNSIRRQSQSIHTQS